MKNKSLLIATVFAASTAFAQDLTSKKGETMLPEAGDWAISFDATPFLNYAGQMFSNAGATSPTAGYTNGYPWSIRGKMFKDEKTAYRAAIRLAFGSNTERAMITTAFDASVAGPVYPAQRPESEETYKASYNGVVLSGGLEMRRGKTRLQGYYGGEVLIGMGGWKDSYTYANALFVGAVTASTPFVDGSNGTEFSSANGDNITGVMDYAGNDARITERKASWMMVGLRGFIGVEYFILPKISVGAEYGWGLGFGSVKTSSAWESNDDPTTAGTYVLGEFTDENKSSGFMIDSDIQNTSTGLGGSGSLNIIFHF